MASFTLAGLLLVCLTVCCSANQELRLAGTLLKNYVPLARPLFNQSESLKVQIGATLINLEYDEDRKFLTQYAWPKIQWTDDFLKWNPQDYGGVTTLRLPIQKLWRPDITLYSAMAPAERLATALAVVSSNGNVLWIPPMKMVSLCPDSEDDESSGGKVRTCVMKFGSWAYSQKELDLELYDGSSTVDTSDYAGALEILDSKVERFDKYYDCCPNDSYPHIKVSIKFKTED